MNPPHTRPHRSSGGLHSNGSGASRARCRSRRDRLVVGALGASRRAPRRLGFGEKHFQRPQPRDLRLREARQTDRLRLAGRIDRIDRISGNHYRVIDYKTGSYSQFEDVKCFGEGRVLQDALYSVAAEEILKKMKIDPAPRVVEGGYSFPTRRGEGKEIIIKEVDRGELGRLLSELMKALKEGRFVVNPEAACDFCDYAPVCGGEAAKERAKQKKDGNAEVFGFFEKLKKYE